MLFQGLNEVYAGVATRYYWKSLRQGIAPGGHDLAERLLSGEPHSALRSPRNSNDAERDKQAGATSA